MKSLFLIKLMWLKKSVEIYVVLLMAGKVLILNRLSSSGFYHTRVLTDANKQINSCPVFEGL